MEVLMKASKRIERVKYWTEKIEAVLAAKQKEYSADGEALHNFYKGAAMSGQSPEQVLYGFLLKHLISVHDIIEGVSNGGPLPTRELIEEKCGDVINYHILLDCLLYDRQPSQQYGESPTSILGDVASAIAKQFDDKVMADVEEPFKGVVVEPDNLTERSGVTRYGARDVPDERASAPMPTFHGEQIDSERRTTVHKGMGPEAFLGCADLNDLPMTPYDEGAGE
jgi:hypothetical protein